MTKELADAELFQGRDAYFADPEGNYWVRRTVRGVSRWLLAGVRGLVRAQGLVARVRGGRAVRRLGVLAAGWAVTVPQGWAGLAASRP